MPGEQYQNRIYLRVLIGIRIDSGENLTSFQPVICIKKIRKTKSVQCFADFLIKVVGGFFAKYKMQLNTSNYVNKIIQRKVQPLLPRFGMATKCHPSPPSPFENPRKLKEKS